MKKFTFLILIGIAVFFSCTNDNSKETEEKQVALSFTFNHFWDTTNISNADFNQFKFTNENGEQISIERLRYVISNITLTDNSGNIISFEDYNLVDVTNNTDLSFALSENVTTGNYQNIAFTFGFTDEDNVDGIYPDLNVANFNVPPGLGGGYHYMQFDGKYLDSNNDGALFNYHTIRAVDRSDPNNLQFKDTSFVVNLGEITINKDSEIQIKADIAEWFKNPNTWNLNELNTVLMPNFSAQKLMNQNGKSVFSLIDVIE